MTHFGKSLFVENKIIKSISLFAFGSSHNNKKIYIYDDFSKYEQNYNKRREFVGSNTASFPLKIIY